MMKDGTTCTCLPINDPNIDHHMDELAQRVHVMRFYQENGPEFFPLDLTGLQGRHSMLA